MRLLNTHTFQLETFDSERARPPYAILSHTWGTDEFLFEDVGARSINLLSAARNAGQAKVIESCREARHNGYRHIWVDTCCINKASSSELSEAVNSMFKWYSSAAVCYVYLADLSSTRVEELPASNTEFARCRWFKRGWTLQELIAPPHVEFFNRDWVQVGTRQSLAVCISHITSISLDILARSGDSGGSLQVGLAATSVATRMSWAAERETTRQEDLAYCLLGLFDVNMPLMYGERKKAFLRLQEQIIKKSNDQSILAWTMVERAWPSPAQELVTGHGLLIRARIMTVDFLDRRGVRLEVEASGCPAGE
ncbi:heterokaryon incompatibility protein-domain-containing protein [Immersiella caudata]|uniref:Heterokaryon incompatibility protein-domain-containing protein n=1 Tax=Immersiella caudata TaxID=314043 RepID=A0AA39WPD7_9PEZI|nr:heterokaryon incompatibility protein-domain-containing protein [Immersiella caudata]